MINKLYRRKCRFFIAGVVKFAIFNLALGCSDEKTSEESAVAAFETFLSKDYTELFYTPRAENVSVEKINISGLDDQGSKLFRDLVFSTYPFGEMRLEDSLKLLKNNQSGTLSEADADHSVKYLIEYNLASDVYHPDALKFSKLLCSKFLEASLSGSKNTTKLLSLLVDLDLSFRRSPHVSLREFSLRYLSKAMCVGLVEFSGGVDGYSTPLKKKLTHWAEVNVSQLYSCFVYEAFSGILEAHIEYGVSAPELGDQIPVVETFLISKLVKNGRLNSKEIGEFEVQMSKTEKGELFIRQSRLYYYQLLHLQSSLLLVKSKIFNSSNLAEVTKVSNHRNQRIKILKRDGFDLIYFLGIDDVDDGAKGNLEFDSRDWVLLLQNTPIPKAE